jgi:hypothetical protein
MVQFIHRANQIQSQRIEMNVANQLQKIDILLAQDRFIAVLKQMTDPAVPPIEAAGISAQNPPHKLGDGGVSGSKQKMKMIGQQRPCKTGCLGIQQGLRNSLKKIIPVGVRPKYLPLFDPPANDMVQSTRRIYACFSRHERRLTRNGCTFNA